MAVDGRRVLLGLCAFQPPIRHQCHFGDDLPDLDPVERIGLGLRHRPIRRSCRTNCRGHALRLASFDRASLPVPRDTSRDRRHREHRIGLVVLPALPWIEPRTARSIGWHREIDGRWSLTPKQQDNSVAAIAGFGGAVRVVVSFCRHPTLPFGDQRTRRSRATRWHLRAITPLSRRACPRP